MIEAAMQAPIQEIFRRASRSFLQYISQATPWFREADRPLVLKIQQLAAEETEGLERLAEWMDSQGIALPYLGAFPITFTNFNFVDVRKLLKPLVAEQARQLARLEKEGKLLPGGESRKAVEALAELYRKHLGAMEELTPSCAA
jgi:hypothetical protein